MRKRTLEGHFWKGNGVSRRALKEGQEGQEGQEGPEGHRA